MKILIVFPSFSLHPRQPGPIEALAETCLEMEGTLIIVLCSIGLVFVLAYMIFRISSHRRKVQRLDDMSMEIGGTSALKGKGRADPGIPLREPVIPENDLIVLFHRNGGKVWLDAFRNKVSNGALGLIVTPLPPGPRRRDYPQDVRTIWLDRSIAHPSGDGATVINPTNLSALFKEVEDHFQGGGGKGLLLLDDFESVLTTNDPQRVIRFLTMVRGSCSTNGFSALVPIAYRAVPQRTRNQLTESMETVVMG